VSTVTVVSTASTRRAGIGMGVQRGLLLMANLLLP
jgi:hypothetical protein